MKDYHSTMFHVHTSSHMCLSLLRCCARCSLRSLCAGRHMLNAKIILHSPYNMMKGNRNKK